MSPNSSSVLVRGFAASSVLALAVGFSGCAHTYQVKVDALTNAEVTGGAAYRIVARDDVKADFDPHFAQNLQLVEQALAARGMYPASNPREAEVVIEIDYGVGSRRRAVRHSMDPFSPAQAYAPQAPATGRDAERTSQSDELTPPVTAMPLTAVTVVMLYEKYLAISARETAYATAGRRAPTEVWRVTVAIEDQATTVEECMPVLVTTAIEKIGTSTAERKMVRVSEKAPMVLIANSDL